MMSVMAAGHHPAERVGPALAEPESRDFKVSLIHASHALPCVYKTSLPLIYEWVGLTRGAEVVKHTLSSLDSEPEALRGPNRGRRAHQGPALLDPLWQPTVPARALCGVLTSARANRHVRRSLVAHVRRTEDTGSISGRLRMPARHAGRHVVWVHGKVAGIGWRARFDCAYHRCSRRGFSGRHLLHHLLTRHSTRRRAPEKLPFFSHPARARPAFGYRAS